MKKFLFLAVSIFVYTNIVASHKKLLRPRAIFRVAHSNADTVCYKQSYYEEEFFDTYIGRPVCEKVIIGNHDTPALKILVGFIGADGKRYTCKPLPDLKENECLVISGKFQESSQSFLMRKEKEDRCCGCVHGKELITFETGLVEPEKK